MGDKRDFNDYKSNKLLRRGIERELEIVGEATNRILKIDKQISISNSRRIVDLRNWLIHGYDTIDDVLIWGIILKDLPKLRDEVNELISN